MPTAKPEISIPDNPLAKLEHALDQQQTTPLSVLESVTLQLQAAQNAQFQTQPQMPNPYNAFQPFSSDMPGQRADSPLAGQSVSMSPGSFNIPSTLGNQMGSNVSPGVAGIGMFPMVTVSSKVPLLIPPLPANPSESQHNPFTAEAILTPKTELDHCRALGLDISGDHHNLDVGSHQTVINSGDAMLSSQLNVAALELTQVKSTMEAQQKLV